MTQVYLISEQTLKDDSLINDNTGVEFISAAIELAQNIHLQELIGSKLLNKICSMVDDDTITGDTNYKLLLDAYITPYLEWMVTSLIQVPVAIKTRNLGVVQTNDDHINNLGLKDVQVMEQYYANKAAFYGLRLSKYLKANSQIYPEWCQCDDCADFKSNPNAFRLPTVL